MTEKPPVGTTVRLKSEGPKMTVYSHDTGEPQTVRCIWFDDNSKRHMKDFPIATLEILED